jgi:hypothetical protein
VAAGLLPRQRCRRGRHPEADEDAVPEDEPSEIDLQKRVLGATYQQMFDDDLTAEEMRIAGLTAMIDAMHGRIAATAYWETAGALGNDKAPMTEDQIRGILQTAGETLQPTAPPAARSTRTGSRSGATAQTKTKGTSTAGRRSRTASNTGT